jgi:prepilin-type N-terminal cleavage/methylation domain-containing protein
MRNNKGLSFVEVMVVIAILAVLSATSITAIVSQSDFYAKKAASAITETLSETRANALARSNAWMELSYDTTKNKYIMTTSTGEEKELGNRFTITYDITQKNGTVTTNDLATSDPLILSYNRSNGAFTGVIASVNSSIDAGDGSTHYSFTYRLDSSGDQLSCTKISVIQGTEHEYEITLYPDTGKYESKRIIK